jgi:hypothetical protein
MKKICFGLFFFVSLYAKNPVIYFPGFMTNCSIFSEYEKVFTNQVSSFCLSINYHKPHILEYQKLSYKIEKIYRKQGPILGIAYSGGSKFLLYLAQKYPYLFKGLFFIDPVAAASPFYKDQDLIWTSQSIAIPTVILSAGLPSSLKCQTKDFSADFFKSFIQSPYLKRYVKYNDAGHGDMIKIDDFPANLIKVVCGSAPQETLDRIQYLTQEELKNFVISIQ